MADLKRKRSAATEEARETCAGCQIGQNVYLTLDLMNTGRQFPCFKYKCTNWHYIAKSDQMTHDVEDLAGASAQLVREWNAGERVLALERNRSLMIFYVRQVIYLAGRTDAQR